LDHKVFQDLPQIQEQQDQQDLLVKLVHKVYLDLPQIQVLQVKLGQQDLLVKLVHKVFQDLLQILVRQVKQGQQVKLDIQEQLVKLDQLGLQEQLDP
jgi:hypothetical protein